MKHESYVYILSNQGNTVLYTGVTSDLVKRISEHKHKIYDGFTKKYNLTKLVYYEACNDIESAIQREKQIKSGSRLKKEKLINQINESWSDLFDSLI